MHTSTFLQRRFAVAMWEFSWLVRRRGAEAEYADWDLVLDELAERGYECIRIDAFPHLIAADADGVRGDRFRVLPQHPQFMWGNHTPVDVEPRDALLAFVGLAARRGLRIGLSSWFNDDTRHRRATLRTPADFARVWEETLALLEVEGLLDAIAWVDLCNEFPLHAWAPGAYETLFGGPPPDMSSMAVTIESVWDECIRSAVTNYLHAAITPLRRRFPEVPFTFSLQGIGASNMCRCGLEGFDLLEAHIWLSDDISWAAESGQLQALLFDPNGVAVHAERMRHLYPNNRTAYLRLLEGRLDLWATWARDAGLPLVTTEGWGPINYDDVTPLGRGGEWDWVKDVCGEAVRMAIEKGWRGICTSNFAQPHFEGMWADIGWHRQLTQLIRTAA